MVDSHVFPRSFYDYSRRVAKMDKADYMEMKSNTEGVFTQKVWIGWYDNDLVCADCEKLFLPFDTYASELLLQNETRHQKMFHDKKLIGWSVDEFDFAKLKLFILSILWRSGASNKTQFRGIELGKWIDVIKKCISENSIKGAESISFIIARFPDDIGRSFLLNPHKEKKGGLFSDLNAYRFYLGAGYILYIKVDSRPILGQFSEIPVAEGMPLRILCRQDMLESAESMVMKKIVLATQK
ncbi:MAG: hypothetical protein UW23_C0019G0018 [Candidatus Collierbacteria bacterium GW2011_GWA1_44_12]|uniref:Uncharacterized protein n=2 Tax=Candidatus Collieribacteriota TaxID=1752725 RepID=A0A0G1JIR8_9BACT|nr:MAG: hypothetical protein UW23_C0019G0018 [Candidatus Collierbacteria bacterium GW2011_GWA1_44_12]